VALAVESLEDRMVPTIVFRPHFGAEALAAGSNYEGMQSPPVFITFWGSYWKDHQQEESNLLASAQSVINSSYFSGLKQYGSDGIVTFGASWEDLSTPAVGGDGQVSTGTLRDFLQGTIDNQDSPIPRPSTPANAPIYVVVTDPISDKGYNGGWNAQGTYVTPIFEPNQTMHMVWVGTSSQGGQVWKDAFTGTLSHELAETISDPDGNGIHVTAPDALPASLKGDNQIGDNEPAAQRYGYRLNGQRVQPYWSVQDNAFIVPDGHAENFILDPIWNGATFTGSYRASGSWSNIDGHNDVAGVAIDSTDTLYALNAIDHGVYRYDGGQSWTQVGSGISSLVNDATGNVFALNTVSGIIYEHVLGAGWNWNQVGSGISSLVSDATGNVFALNPVGQTVFEHIQGAGWNWDVVGNGVISLVSDATGNIFALNPVGEVVFEHVLGAGWNWYQVGNGVNSLVSDATGNVFALNPVGGTVFEHILGAGWNWNVVGNGLANLISDVVGNVFATDAATGAHYKHVLGAGWDWVPV
jgi:hypothetical protein